MPSPRARTRSTRSRSASRSGRRSPTRAARSGSDAGRKDPRPTHFRPLRRQVERTRIVSCGGLPLQQAAERLEVMRLTPDAERVSGQRHTQMTLEIANRVVRKEDLEIVDVLRD